MSTLEVKAIQAPTGFDLQMPAGHVIQAVSGTPLGTSTQTTTISSWVNGGTTVNITPTNASNKILVFMNVLGGTNNSNPYTRAMYTIFRSINSGTYSDILNFSSTDGGGNVYGGPETGTYTGVTELQAYTGLQYLDSPNTTSAITYRIHYRSMGGYGTAHLRKGSTLLAMEVSG